MYDSADQENAQWDLFLEEWQKQHRDDPITAAILKAELTDYHDVYKTFQNEMPEEVIKATSKGTRGALALGQTLRRRADQIFPSGRKLTSVIDTHTKTSQWKVTTVKREDCKVVEDTPPSSSVCCPTQNQAQEAFAGIEKTSESQPSDRFAGIAGIGFVLGEILDENSKDSKKYICMKQIPAIPAHQQAEPQNDEIEIPADRPMTVSESNQHPPAVGAKSALEGEDSGAKSKEVRWKEDKLSNTCGSCPVALRGDKSAIKCDPCTYLGKKEVRWFKVQMLARHEGHQPYENVRVDEATAHEWAKLKKCVITEEANA